MSSYLSAVWQCRYFWLSLVKMDLRTRYRGSLLGIGWSLLQPLCMTAILCTVFCKIFRVDISWFGPYLLSGLACWSFILNVTLGGCGCFHQAEPYIRQYPAPLAIYPLRTVLGTTFHFLLALGIVLLLVSGFLWLVQPLSGYASAPTKPVAVKTLGTPAETGQARRITSEATQEEPLGLAKDGAPPDTTTAAAKAIGAAEEPPEARGKVKEATKEKEQLGSVNPFALLTLVPTLLLLMVFGWSLAMLGGLATVHFPDTKHLLEVGFQGLFYLTGIMYPPSILQGRLGLYLNYNPLTSFLRLLRDPIVWGRMPTLTTFGIAAATTLLVTVLAVVSLSRLEKRFIYYL
jgi:ABC-type polysaccharide/polyol phosphate export permease